MSTRVRTTKRIEQPAADAGAVLGPDREGQGVGATAEASAGATPERIRARAYEIFLARGNGDGDALADWLLAELELTGANSPVAAPDMAINDKPTVLDTRSDGQGSPS